MKVEKQRAESVFLNQMNTEELGKILVTLVKNNREVRKAIIELVLASPYIVRQY